jgi:hypothetical protein
MTHRIDDFSQKVKETLKQRAAFICSNPDCRKMTIAPSIEAEDKVQYMGKCAHITAASKGGPRYDEKLKPEERASINNGIFLCANCADLIDKNDGLDYPESLLRKWKEDHDKWIATHLNKSIHQSDNFSFAANSFNQMGGINASVVNIDSRNLSHIDTSKEHDKAVFKQAEIILDEDTLIYIANWLTSDESIKSDNNDKLEQLKYFLEKSSNNFVDQQLDTSRKDLIVKLDTLNSFIYEEFDMYPYNQRGSNVKYCMKPTVNIDRGGKFDDAENQEHTRLKSLLILKTKDLLESYRKHRQLIKLILHV